MLRWAKNGSMVNANLCDSDVCQRQRIAAKGGRQKWGGVSNHVSKVRKI